MNAPEQTRSLQGQQCPARSNGQFQLVQIDHTEEVASDNPIEFRGIWVDRCDHCGEIVFPGDTTAFIESVVAEETEQLTPRELERIREDLGVATQDEMSEILGLGLKTFHKWESGRQFPTRSMSYYIRLLSEFPEAFDWLHRRAWRPKNRVKHSTQVPDIHDRFPDLPRLGAPLFRTVHAPNPARGFETAAF